MRSKRRIRIQNVKVQQRTPRELVPLQLHFFTFTVYTSLHTSFPGTPEVFQTLNYMPQVKRRMCERLFSALPFTKSHFSSTHQKFFLLSNGWSLISFKLPVLSSHRFVHTTFKYVSKNQVQAWPLFRKRMLRCTLIQSNLFRFLTRKFLTHRTCSAYTHWHSLSHGGGRGGDGKTCRKETPPPL
jgi:hypothetical protein